MRLSHGAHAHDFLFRILRRPALKQFAGLRLDDGCQTILSLVGSDSHAQHYQLHTQKSDEANARRRQSDERSAIVCRHAKLAEALVGEHAIWQEMVRAPKV